MFAAFIILLPAGILAANLFSRTHARQSWWFYAHAVLTGLGSLLGVAGLGIGLVLMVPTYYAMIHRWIGISIIIAIVIQVRHSGNPQGVWMFSDCVTSQPMLCVYVPSCYSCAQQGAASQWLCTDASLPERCAGR